MAELRTLWIAHKLPSPALNGRELRNWQNIRGLAQSSVVGVFGILARNAGGENRPPLTLAFWRTPNSSTLADPTYRFVWEARAWPLNPLGHPADAYYTEAIAGEIADIVSRFKPQ